MKPFARCLVLAAVIFGALTATLGWSLFTAVSSCITASALVLIRDGIRPRSRLLGLVTVAWVYWGLTYVSNVIEAVYFTIMPGLTAILAALIGLATSLVVAGCLEYLTPFQITKSVYPVVLAPGAWWRIPVLALAFFVIYLAAGIAIHPWIAAFYAHRQLPALPQLLRLQLCRGALDISFVYPIYRRWGQSRRAAAWVSACMFPILCGWGPLLLPNPFLPGAIRLAHAAEMGVQSASWRGQGTSLATTLSCFTMPPPTARRSSLLHRICCVSRSQWALGSMRWALLDYAALRAPGICGVAAHAAAEALTVF